MPFLISPTASSSQGATGPTGPTGATGSQGIQGIQGEQGLQGPKGDTGDQGPQGIQGNNGTSVTLKGSVANVILLPNSGNILGDSYINQDDGNLYVWDGSSWFDSGQIVGPQGPQGPQGATGAQGPQGETGVQGPQGVQGATGATGATGANGASGSAGSQGLKGDTGAGVASGGSTDQILSKVNSTDYNTHWITNNLNNLSDVTITGTPANQQLIVYNSTSGVWENKDAIIATGLVYKALYPNNKTATGTLGEICIDGANGTMYVCTGNNTWQKVSLNSANFTNTGGFN